MDLAVAAALQRRAAPQTDFTNTLLRALKEVEAQGTPSSWAPKARNPMLPESDVESIAGLPPGDTPRSAWHPHARSRFDSILQDDEGSEPEVAHVEPTRRTGSGGGEVAAGSTGQQRYSREDVAPSEAGSEEARGYLQTITGTLLPSVVGFGLALLVSGATMPLLRPNKQRNVARQYQAGRDMHRDDDLWTTGHPTEGDGPDADFRPAADLGTAEMDMRGGP